MNKRILITGGAGFIGFHLAKELLRRNENVIVTVLDNFSNSARDKDFQDLLAKYPDTLKVLELDLAYESLEKLEEIEVDEVYHLAGVRGTKYANHGANALSVNIMSTFRVIEWYRETQAKVLFASTGEVWGGLPPYTVELPAKETCPVGFSDVYDARWTYAASKIAGEMAFIHTPGTWRWSIVRMQNPYGPRMGWDNVVPKFIQKILDGEQELWVQTPMDTRPFTYIDDVVDGLIRVMESAETNGQIINVASPLEVTVGALARRLLRIAGHDGLEAKYPDTPQPIREYRKLDVIKLYKLGWQPTVDLEEGLRRTFEWYKAHHGVSTV